MPQDHSLPGFNFNVEEWDDKAFAVCRTLALARGAFAVATASERRNCSKTSSRRARSVASETLTAIRRQNTSSSMISAMVRPRTRPCR